jgi:hypothetical protein
MRWGAAAGIALAPRLSTACSHQVGKYKISPGLIVHSIGFLDGANVGYTAVTHCSWEASGSKGTISLDSAEMLY